MTLPEELRGSGRRFHVSSALNRQSITQYGLDWTRMGAARGIAGSCHPEQSGCFIALDGSEADWFARMGLTFGPVDVWEVDGVVDSEFIESPEGYYYIERTVPAHRLRLTRRQVTDTG